MAAFEPWWLLGHDVNCTEGMLCWQQASGSLGEHLVPQTRIPLVSHWSLRRESGNYFPARALPHSQSLSLSVWHVQLNMRCQTICFLGATLLNTGEKSLCPIQGHKWAVQVETWAGFLLGTFTDSEFEPRMVEAKGGASSRSASEELVTSGLPPVINQHLTET